MTLALHFAFALIYVLIFDALFIGLVLRRFFSPMIKSVQGSDLVLHWQAAIPCYLIIAFSIAYFALPNVSDESVVIGSLQWGMVWGLTVYAIYDLTNLSILKNYTYKVAAMDIAWGGVLGFLVTLCTKYTTMAIYNKNK